jgi:translation initiation factor 2 alpha subunit (eIF-2alpha)
MDNFQVYCKTIPKKYDNILVIFNNRNNTHIEGESLEYNFKCIMSYNDATKKKRIYSWNKLVPLNKPMVARVDEVFEESAYIQVSIAYFDNLKKDENALKELLRPFNNNKILMSQIKKMCHETTIDFNKFWIDIIHPLDYCRNEEESELCLLDYYKNNFDKLEDLVNIHYDFCSKIIELVDIISEQVDLTPVTESVEPNTDSDNEPVTNPDTEPVPTNVNKHIICILRKINSETINKIISKVGLISMNGINKTKEVIRKVIEHNNDWEYTFKYDTPPYYILESKNRSYTNDENKHEKFIRLLESEAKKESQLFTKIDFIGKKIC